MNEQIAHNGIDFLQRKGNGFKFTSILFVIILLAFTHMLFYFLYVISEISAQKIVEIGMIFNSISFAQIDRGL
jgi:hypothetical protein